jgi:hypothetical protein
MIRRVTTERGLPALEFVTRTDGHVITAIAVRAGRRALALHTMQRRKGPPPVVAVKLVAPPGLMLHSVHRVAPAALRPKRRRAPPKLI